MATDKIKRKLTAILSADVKGYSRLMGEDEEATIRRLNAYKEAITGFIRKHEGQVVGTAGDSVLAEFASVVDAVRCAVEIQEELKERNKELPEGRRMEFRIGVNLGDVVEEGDNILGDGVNIAARVQSLAEAGGICISGTAYDHVKNKVPLVYEYLGEQTAKNIVDPVRVYRVLMDPARLVSRVSGWKKVVVTYWRKTPTVLKALATLVIALNAAWQLYSRVLSTPSEVAPPKKIISSSSEKSSTTPNSEVASKEKMALPLPDVPSIAVLPFDNMSRDPKEEFLSDGVTESIITALSKVPRLFVIARNSTFTYKGKPVRVKQVSEELGVQYVLEGSIQRAGDRVRITAQLIDALTGNHLWAERYDRDLQDIFALQDEITIKILEAIRVKLTEGELSSPRKFYRGKQGLDCYLKVLEAMEYHNRFTIQDTNLARQKAEEAIAMCPESPGPYWAMAWVHYNDYFLALSRSPQESLDKAIELGQKALVLDDSNAEFHGALCVFYTPKREYDKAIAEGERALVLNPGGATVLVNYAGALNFAGRPEEAIPLFQKAIRLNPRGPAFYFTLYGMALTMTGRLEEAVSEYKKGLQRAPESIPAHTHLAATYSMMGREKEAHAEAAQVLKINPKFSLDYWAKVLPYKDQSVTDRLVAALRKAGLK
jgi:adenylate cyclase